MRRVAILSRAPLHGPPEPELAQRLGVQTGWALHRAMVHDELEALRRAGLFAVLAHGAPGDDRDAALVEDLAGPAPRLLVPGNGDGAELHAVFHHLCRRGPAVVLVADVPQVRGDEVRRALDTLAEADVVIGACLDGRYWMIGLRRPYDLFAGLPGDPRALFQNTVDRARTLGLDVRFAEPLRAVQTPEDLANVAPTLRAASHTRRVFADLVERPDYEEAESLPRRLNLELTNKCNSACRHCVGALRREPPQEMSVDDAKRILAMLPELHTVVLHVNGEPLLYRQLGAVIHACKQRGIRVEINTNGLSLTPRRCAMLVAQETDLVNVSLDAATPATYRRIRGVDAFARVVANVGRLAAARTYARPRIALWMTATDENVHELPDLVRLASDLGVEEVFLQHLVFFGAGLAKANHSLHDRVTRAQRVAIDRAERVARERGIALKAGGGVSPLEMLSRPPELEPWRACRRPWESAAVHVNGDVVPCCVAAFVAPRSAARMGNVLQQSWEEVWNGSAYRALRAQLREGVGPSFCRRCGSWWSL